MKNLWKNNTVQFPRLISELDIANAFTPDVIQSLCDAMDLEEEDIFELITRATETFDGFKKHI